MHIVLDSCFTRSRVSATSALNLTLGRSYVMRKLFILISIVALSVLVLLPPSAVQGQKDDSPAADKPTGKITRSYRNGEGARPDWVEDSLRRSVVFLKRHGATAGVRNPESELTLLTAKQDDLGQTHVRLDQVHQGVPVYGRQVITHLVGNTVRDVTGSAFEGVRGLSTTP
jgi:Zn-dependent metalloprotease